MEVIPTALVAPLFNPATFAVRGAVDSLLTEIRRDYPLAQAEVPGFDPHWIVSRHADIQEVSRQNELFHNADRSATLIPQMGEVLVQQFTGGEAALETEIEELVQSLGKVRDQLNEVKDKIESSNRKLNESMDRSKELHKLIEAKNAELSQLAIEIEKINYS